jgi:hypothetical protein
MPVTVKDIPFLSRLLYRECERVRHGGLQVAWEYEDAGVFLGNVLNNPLYHLEVIREGGVITTACGVALVKTLLPPHPLVMIEWLWQGGSKKHLAQVWQKCKAWGKSQGAEYAQYALGHTQNNPKKFTETFHWIRL